MKREAGKCLCGDIRYETTSNPDWVTICSCRFCQRATGGAYLVEPIFPIEAHDFTSGKPTVYTHRSEGSGKDVYVHFCPKCGTKLCLTFERWPDRLGVFAGTFDNPNWFDQNPENTKYIFTSTARQGTILPPHFNTFPEHAATTSGDSLEPVVFDDYEHIGK